MTEQQRHYDLVKDVYAALMADGVSATEARTLSGQAAIVAAFERELLARGLAIVPVPPGMRLEAKEFLAADHEMVRDSLAESPRFSGG